MQDINRGCLKYVRHRFVQHAARPLPIIVTDQTRIPDDEKLGWILHELGHGQSLTAFAAKFRDIVGMQRTGAKDIANQKTRCCSSTVNTRRARRLARAMLRIGL